MSIERAAAIRVLLVDDDEDDYLITSEMLAGQRAAARFDGRLARRTTPHALARSASSATTST